MKQSVLLDQLGLHAFMPLPPFYGGWSQTIAAPFFPQQTAVKPDRFHDVDLPDGDRLRIAENRPPFWREGDRIAILMHGLTGCHTSNYMIRLSRKLSARGILNLRVNLRGCGPGEGLARRTYHSGRSEDAKAVLEWAARCWPRSPATLIGFSLGGNIALKAAGEISDGTCGNFDSVVAISAPANLAASVRRLAQGQNQFFDRYFVRRLRAEIARRHHHFPDIPTVDIPSGTTLTGFDDLYTAPQNGYRDAADYYAQASSAPLLKRIARPGLILCADDDPIVDSATYHELAAQTTPLDVHLTASGGHVAYVGKDDRGLGFRWMDALIVRWIDKHRERVD